VLSDGLRVGLSSAIVRVSIVRPPRIVARSLVIVTLASLAL